MGRWSFRVTHELSFMEKNICPKFCPEQTRRFETESTLCSAILETTGALVVVLDRQGRIVLFNPACERVSGYAFEEVKGKGLCDLLLPPEEGAPVRTVFEELKAGNFPNEIENHWRTKDGSLRLIAWSNTALVDGMGSVEYVIGTGIDITERNRALEWYRGVIQTAMDGFWVTDTDGRFLEVNEAYCNIIGYSRAELLAKKIHDVEAVERPEETDRHIRKIKQVGRDRFETRHRRRDGQIVDLEVSVNYTPIGGGRLFVFLRDITERKSAQEAIRKRSLELEAANRELEAFSYSVSHDLRSPLITVRALMEMFLKKYGTEIDGKCRELLETVYQKTGHMGRLIEDLLSFSRFAHQDLNHSAIDMTALARETSSELEAGYPDREIRISIHPLPSAWGDPATIRQVFVNLISNALKFTAGRDRTVIEIGANAEIGRNVYYVRDNGIGFDMAERHSVFEPFKRLHEGEYEGTGIGLALTQRIIQRHSGEVWAVGTPGDGAVFYFTLPHSRPQNGEEDPI